ncbi:MAG: hypothetical protein ISN26_03985, partial [Betaproteobacteria bacterium AqS2]|nr:hypothetical protein [Betaproteobacteria bacterium AqS2]
MLHKVSDGIQERSYGIHVAGMAGVPPHVLDCAREFAARLPAAPAEAAAAAPRADRLRDRLRAAELDALSPRQALELLYELRDLDREG